MASTKRGSKGAFFSSRREHGRKFSVAAIWGERGV